MENFVSVGQLFSSKSELFNKNYLLRQYILQRNNERTIKTSKQSRTLITLAIALISCCGLN